MEAVLNEEQKTIKPKSNLKIELQVAYKLVETVGTPEGFVGVKVHQITGSWFRVNMRALKPGHTGMVPLTYICHSYFVQFKDGNFVDGDKVEKVYGE